MWEEIVRGFDRVKKKPGVRVIRNFGNNFRRSRRSQAVKEDRRPERGGVRLLKGVEPAHRRRDFQGKGGLPGLGHVSMRTKGVGERRVTEAEENGSYHSVARE